MSAELIIILTLIVAAALNPALLVTFLLYGILALTIMLGAIGFVAGFVWFTFLGLKDRLNGSQSNPSDKRNNRDRGSDQHRTGRDPRP